MSLKSTLSFLDCGIREWIRDSREDEALADIDSAERFGVSCSGKQRGPVIGPCYPEPCLNGKRLDSRSVMLNSTVWRLSSIPRRTPYYRGPSILSSLYSICLALPYPASVRSHDHYGHLCLDATKWNNRIPRPLALPCVRVDLLHL